MRLGPIYPLNDGVVFFFGVVAGWKKKCESKQNVSRKSRKEKTYEDSWTMLKESSTNNEISYTSQFKVRNHVTLFIFFLQRSSIFNIASITTTTNGQHQLHVRPLTPPSFTTYNMPQWRCNLMSGPQVKIFFLDFYIFYKWFYLQIYASSITQQQ
jgi:hypothetical protein